MKILTVCSLGAALLTLGGMGHGVAQMHRNDAKATATPVKHVVVIFGENISFDHYFGTYPNALNPAGEPAFHAKPGTPAVNGLATTLLEHNPNLINTKVNGKDATAPFRLSRAQAATADENHEDRKS